MEFSNRSQDVFSEEEDKNNEDDEKLTDLENNEIAKDILKEKINKDEKNIIEKKESEKENYIEKPIQKLLRLIFDIKEAKKYLSFLGIDITGIPISKATNDLYINAFNKLNEIDNIIHQSKITKLKNKKLFDLSKKYY